jgi:DNA invertase Pin-like site-specific DNA recombinase
MVKTAYPQKILDSKFVGNNIWYLIQWKSYRLPTWEPKKNIEHRQDLIEEYRELSMLENLNLDDVVYIYCRVSSKQQSIISNGNTSLEVQENLCRRYCENKGYRVIKVVKEVYSARNMDKLSGLDYLCDIAVSGQKIIVYDISRFSRNTRQALNILEDLKNKNVSVYSVAEKLSYDNPAEQHQFRMQLSCSQQYSDMCSLKVSNSVLYRKNIGHSLGPASFGYKHIRDDNNIRKKVVNDEEMKIIERIRLLKNETPKIIVNILIDEDIEIRGRNPTISNVKNIIKRFDKDLIAKIKLLSSKTRKGRKGRSNTKPY